MILTSVKSGDIVEVDIKGRRFFAEVTGRRQSGLQIKPINRNISWFAATANQVVGVYHMNKATRERKFGN